jgi:hypothetical protein
MEEQMNKVNILISVTAYMKMKAWIDMARGEVSGLGSVSEVRDRNGELTSFIIDDIYLLKQQCGSADTLLDNEAVGQFLFETAKEGLDTSKIKLWWHSHGTLSVFWSTTDEQCIRDLSNSSYMISLVSNKEGKSLTRLDVYKPFHITLNDFQLQMHYPEDPDTIQFCLNEFKKKVTESTLTPIQDRLIPEPGQDRIDEAVEALEDKFNRGQIGLEEYEERLLELQMEEQEMMEYFS